MSDPLPPTNADDSGAPKKPRGGRRAPAPYVPPPLASLTQAFTPWLFQQRRRTDPVGSAAREAFADPHWPEQVETLVELKRYFTSTGASQDLRNAFIQSWYEWGGWDYELRMGTATRETDEDPA